MAVEVSVVIPAYRAGQFIHRAIRSALDQDDVDVEVIVAEDACPEDTAATVAAQFGDEDRVRIVRLPENGGPSAARNAGIDAAEGEWIAILDADDSFDQGRLRRLVDYGRAQQADVVADNVQFFDHESGATSRPMLHPFAQPRVLSLHEFVAAARPGTGEMDYGLLKPVYRRGFLGDRFRYPAGVRHGEDFLFYFDLLSRGAHFVLHPQPGYFWTLRNSGFSQTQINYGGMADRATQMAAEYADSDPELDQLLRERANALMLFHEREVMFAHRRNGDYLRFLKMAVTHPRLWPALRVSLRDKLRKIFGRR